MSGATRFWWIRHAPVSGDHGGRLYGQLDVPCDVSDGAGIAALAARLPAGALWVTTPFRRTRETVAALGRAGIEVPEPLVEAALSEQHFGAWQGLTWDEMEARDPAAFRAFWRSPWRNRPPGGESFDDLVARARAAIERLAREHTGRDVIGVVHGGTVRAAVALALGLDRGKALALRVDNLSLTRLDHLEEPLLRGRGGRWRVMSVNAPAR
jgi:alpha-ribazole phosphatase